MKVLLSVFHCRALRKHIRIVSMSVREYGSAGQKFKIACTQPIPDAAISILNQIQPDLHINTKTPLARGDLIELVKDSHAIFCTLNEKIDKEVLDAAGKQLKVVATCSVGYDHIDLKECAQRNIPVGYTPGVLTDATAEFTVGLLLNTSRRVSESIAAAKQGQWKDWKIMWMCGQGLSGANVGIFGLGRIGMAVAKRIHAFGPNKIMYCNRSVVASGARKMPEADNLNLQNVDLSTLLEESDFLICTCAATKETEKIFNIDLFKKMRPTAIFINVSRGNVVDQDDLCFALKNNMIHAAGLDVCTPEPLPVDHDLFKLNNCIITPHICSAEMSTRLNMSKITATNIVRALLGEHLIHQIKL